MPDPRTAGKYLVPYRFEQDGITGHITWHCRIEVVDDQGNVMQGPPVLHGTDYPDFRDQYGGSHERFLVEYVKPKMLAHHEAITASHDEAKELQGKSL
jgi:hypothetical protein